MVRIEDVARHAGVHKSTVSRTWSDPDRVDPDTRARIHAAAQELGYRPNAIAHMLATRTNPLVPLLVPDVANPFFAELARGVAQAVEASGRHLMLCDTRGGLAGEQRYLGSLRSLQVELLIVAPGLETELPELIAHAQDASPVTVLVDRVPDGSPISSVSVDQTRGINLALAHLYELGHRRLVHASGPMTTRTGRERCEAFAASVGEMGLEPTVVPGGYDSRGGRAAADAILALPELPTGVVAANDLCALGLIGRFVERGLAVPGDVSVIGFDGLDLASYVQPPLTTVQQPIADIGANAVEIGLEEAARVREGDRPLPRHTRLVPSLVVGGTAARPARPMAGSVTSEARVPDPA